MANEGNPALPWNPAELGAWGFLYRPTPKEALNEYLKNKILNLPIPDGLVMDFDVYCHRPSDIPVGQYPLWRRNEGYFFTEELPLVQNNVITVPGGYWQTSGEPHGVFNHVGKLIGLYDEFEYFQEDGTKTEFTLTEYRFYRAILCIAKAYVMCKVCCEEVKSEDESTDYDSDNAPTGHDTDDNNLVFELLEPETNMAY